MWIVLGALTCAASVAAGAFGAHALAERLDDRALQLWETAARYLMYGGLGALVAALLLSEQERGAAGWPPGLLLLGGWLFAGTLFAMALGGPRWLGAVTPLGGLGLILGFVLLAWLGR